MLWSTTTSPPPPWGRCRSVAPGWPAGSSPATPCTPRPRSPLLPIETSGSGYGPFIVPIGYQEISFVKGQISGHRNFATCPCQTGPGGSLPPPMNNERSPTVTVTDDFGSFLLFRRNRIKINIRMNKNKYTNECTDNEYNKKLTINLNDAQGCRLLVIHNPH